MTPYSAILFPVDFSERSFAAAPFVLSMAQRWKAPVALLNVLQPLPATFGGMDVVYPETLDLDSLAADAQRKLRGFAGDQLPRCNVSCHVLTGDPGRKIVEFVQSRYTGLIALPTHGYGMFKRLLLGSVAAKVLHDARAPVWTSAHCPDPSHRAHPQPRHILCAIDLKAESRHVLNAATALAQDAGARLEILHVAPEGEIAAEEREARIGRLLSETAGSASLLLADQGPTPPVITEDASVADVVRETALHRRSDLIVVGRDHRRFTPVGIGSDTYQIIREAPCPVLSV